jgi:hypothetical protein
MLHLIVVIISCNSMEIALCLRNKGMSPPKHMRMLAIQDFSFHIAIGEYVYAGSLLSLPPNNLRLLRAAKLCCESTKADHSLTIYSFAEL